MKITIHLLAPNESRARYMLDLAHDFASDYPNRPSGERNGVVWARLADGWAMVAYWTRARAVVVREIRSEVSDV